MPGPATAAAANGSTEVRVLVVQDGRLRMPASELASLGATVQLGGVTFRIVDAGKMLELVAEEAR